MAMTDEQIERYSRHIILNEVGVKGQKKLLKGKVLIIGAGGLGAPAAMYLAAAGVGTIGIVDADEVDLSNLQRQIIHGTADVGKAKRDNERHEPGCSGQYIPYVCRCVKHQRAYQGL